ncbi:MAG: hypothetical protein QM791_20575 [Ferruginibacter sp.]
MKDDDTTNQEVLLNIHSSFCKRQWCEKNTSQQPLSSTEQLKTICWDGMLPDLFPEICIKENNKPLVLWELLETEHLLHLRMGDYNEKLGGEESLHPYLLMSVVNYN